ncbi:hypothetical protein U1Q18_000833 [Sarracenia purpurea var. burkii]
MDDRCPIYTCLSLARQWSPNFCWNTREVSANEEGEAPQMAYVEVKKAHPSGLRTEPAKTAISSVEPPTPTIPVAKQTRKLVVWSVGT